MSPAGPSMFTPPTVTADAADRIVSNRQKDRLNRRGYASSDKDHRIALIYRIGYKVLAANPSKDGARWLDRSTIQAVFLSEVDAREYAGKLRKAAPDRYVEVIPAREHATKGSKKGAR